MLDTGEYQRWMSQARKTPELVDADIEYGGYSWACFKAQQAAEYALKALPMLYGEPLSTHDLRRLLEHATGLRGEQPPGEVVDCVHLLDKMYIPPRHPDAFPEGAPWEHYTRREALEAKRCTMLVVGWVERCAARALEAARAEETGCLSSSANG